MTHDAIRGVDSQAITRWTCWDGRTSTAEESALAHIGDGSACYGSFVFPFLDPRRRFGLRDPRSHVVGDDLRRRALDSADGAGHLVGGAVVQKPADQRRVGATRQQNRHLRARVVAELCTDELL